MSIAIIVRHYVPVKWVPAALRISALKICALVTATLVVLAACTSEAARVCGPIISDELDPLSDQHVLPTAQISYLQDPPTSGPHLSAAPPSGALDTPISPAVQVTALEAGYVIIQYLDGVEIDAAIDLAADDVVVAPADSLPSQVVLTAWQTRQECESFDAASARSFIRDHAGQGPSHG